MRRSIFIALILIVVGIFLLSLVFVDHTFYTKNIIEFSAERDIQTEQFALKSGTRYSLVCFHIGKGSHSGNVTILNNDNIEIKKIEVAGSYYESDKGAANTPITSFTVSNSGSYYINYDSTGFYFSDGEVILKITAPSIQQITRIETFYISIFGLFPLVIGLIILVSRQGPRILEKLRKSDSS